MRSRNRAPCRARALAALAFLTCLPGVAEQIAAELDPALTHVEFTVADVLHTVHGRFRLRSGTIEIDTLTGKMHGMIVVDAGSGNSGSAARDKRMETRILENEKYPEITFSPDRMDGDLKTEGDSSVRVHGMFTIHGAAHEMTVPVETHIAAGQIAATLRFDVPYVKWGMKNPSTLFLRVNDSVAIEIHAVGHFVSAPGQGKSSLRFGRSFLTARTI